MAKIKKYYPGTDSLYSNTGGWSYGFGGNSGMTNPGNQTLKQKTTNSSSSIPTGTLPTTGNISDLANAASKSGGGSSPLTGLDIGGLASSVGGSIAMLINANKKDPNPGRPYKTGTKMIKYQKGTKSSQIIKHIYDENKSNASINAILNANIEDARKNAELRKRIPPKKLEGKQASLSLDTLKTNKPNLIKYQEGNEYLQAGKGTKNFLNSLEENNSRLLNSSIKNAPEEKFDIASLSDNMPDIPRRFARGSKAPNDTQVGPSRKEMADLMRAYNKKENAAGRLGYLDEDYLERKFAENQQMVGGKIEPNVRGKIETLSPRMASLKLASSSRLPERLNTVPVKEQSRRERKEENRRLEGMAKAPITYNENAFVGPYDFVGPSDMAGPSNQELKLGRTREDAESARKTYETRLAGENARSAYEAKQKGTPITDALLKSTMSSQAFKETMPNRAGLVSFKDMTPAQQKQYRAGIASGREFTVEGIGKYAAASKEKQAQSAKMATKSGGAKPLIKMKEDSWTEAQWQKFLKDRNKSNTSGAQNVPQKGNTGKELVLESRRGKSFDPYSAAFFTTPFNQPGKTTSAPKVEKRTEKKTAPKTAPKPMSDDFFERLTGVAKNLNTGIVKQKEKDALNKFRKSGKMQGLQESLEYMKNVAGGRYKTPEAPRADAGKKGVKTYWERVTSKQTERDPRAQYDYEKLAPWGKVKSEGALDYLSTLFSSPQKTTNYLLTGRYERPIDTYNLAKSKDDRIKGNWKLAGDIATDPMMYPEAFYGAGKMVGQGAIKAGKAIGGVLKKIPYAKIG